MLSDNLTIINETNGKLPRLPFVSMKEKILGKKYELGISFIGPVKSRKLNNTYRNKNNSTNILSFPTSNNSGDIFIDLSTAKKEAPKFNRNFDNFIAFLLIHGLTHLKGFDHGDKMEEAEKKYRKFFSI